MTAPSRLGRIRHLVVSALAATAMIASASPESWAAAVCWKPTHTRGVGELPKGCPSGWELGDVVGEGVLCYPKCESGFNGKGPVCWQRCPDGFRNDGAYCRKPDGYWHGNVGRVRKSRCERDAGGGNCEYDAGLWYPKCKSGFTVIGLRCSPKCPSGMTDIGISCQKKSYGRGVGKAPESCGPGKEPGGVIGNGILCYPSCKAGFTGRGPVCWGQCPSGYQSCPNSGGAMCATSSAACKAAIKEQVVASIATVSKVVNIAKLAQAGTLTAEYVEDWISDALHEAAIETKDQLVDALEKAAKDAGVGYVKGEYDSLSDAIIKAGKGIEIDWSKVDPTSIFDLVKAFNHKTCDLPEWAQEQVVAKPIRAKIQRVDYSANAICPKKVKVVGDILFDRMPAVGKFRLRVDGKLSELYVQSAQEEVAQTTGGNFHIGDPFYIVRFEKEFTLPPGQHTFKLEIRDSDLTDTVEREIKCPPFRVTDAKLEFDGGEAPYCPRTIKTRATFTTNGPGTLEYRRERQGGDPSDWIKATAKLVGDRYRAIVENTQDVGEIDQVRRVMAKIWNDGKRGAIVSDWVHYKVECLEIEDADIIYDGPVEKTCRYDTNVRLRVNADMEHKLPYRLDCADGQSREGILDIRNTSPGTFIGVDALKLDVKKTGKQICVLKSDTGEGLRNLAFRGLDLTCLDVLGADLYIDGPEEGPCPAELDIRARFDARDKVAIGYGLVCSNGQSWTGKLPVQEAGPGNLVGITTKKLEVTESGQIACALKSHLTGEPKIVALRGKTFQCIDVARPGPSGDLTVDQREPDTAMAEDCVEPVPSADDNPVGHTQAMLSRLGFDPGPVDGQMGPRTGAAIEAFQQIGELPVTGNVDATVLQALQAYGTVEDGDAAGVPCASPQEAIEEVAAEPEPEQQAEEPSPPSVADPAPQVTVCRNGAIRGGDCVCRRGWTRTRVSRFEYVCNRPVVRIACDNGTVRAGQCVCRPGWRLNRIAPNRFECLRPVVRIVCEGGKVSGRRCVCPQDTTRHQRSANNFQCLPSRPRRIVCTGGVVRDNQCFCPRATTRQTVGPNRFECTCPRGLRLVRGQCIRPAG